jgi:hypothetical protein
MPWLGSACAVFFLALSLVVSGACAALSWRHATRVARASDGDARSLSRALRAIPGEARLPELARRSPPGSWEHRLALALIEASGPRARIAAANELLAELELQLDAGAGWPPAAARLSSFAAMLLATLSFLTGAGLPAIALVLAAGATGALVSAAAGRAARRAAAMQREAVDGLVDAALGPIVAAEAMQRDPPRRSRRARS